MWWGEKRGNPIWRALERFRLWYRWHKCGPYIAWTHRTECTLTVVTLSLSPPHSLFPPLSILDLVGCFGNFEGGGGYKRGGSQKCSVCCRYFKVDYTLSQHGLHSCAVCDMKSHGGWDYISPSIVYWYDCSSLFILSFDGKIRNAWIHISFISR